MYECQVFGIYGIYVVGISMFPITVEFWYFGGKTLHYSIMMMALRYIANDIISLSGDYKKMCAKFWSTQHS